MELIFTFTTGRTGTAMIAQAFSMVRYEKGAKYTTVNGENLIAHECWDYIPIEKIKLHKFESLEYHNICKEYLDKKILEIKKEYPTVKRVFITDHRLGRFFARYLIESGLNYKIVCLRRCKKEVVQSFDDKLKKKERAVDRKQYIYHQRRLWKNSFYNPFDAFALYPISPIEWSIKNNEERLTWYFDEVKRQWNELVKFLPKDKYVEIGFENIVSSLDSSDNGSIVCPELNKLSSFIKMPYNKELLRNKINQR